MRPYPRIVLFFAGALIIFAALITLRQLEPPASFDEPTTTPSQTVTPTTEAKQLLIWGDSGTGDDLQTKLAADMLQYCSTTSCDAGVIAGDVIYPSGVKSQDDSQFNTKFSVPYQKLNIPIYVAFGNHDYAGCIQCYLDYAKTSGQFKMPERYYSQTIADNVTLFVIDTENFDSLQQQWLTTAIDVSTARWKIVVGHRPIITYESQHHDENWSGKDKLTEIICHKVQLYVSGHSHVLEDPGTLPDCSTKLLVSGGGGSEARSMLPGNPDAFAYTGNGFLAVRTGDKLSYQFIDENGKTIWQGELK